MVLQNPIHAGIKPAASMWPVPVNLDFWNGAGPRFVFVRYVPPSGLWQLWIGRFSRFKELWESSKRIAEGILCGFP